jgi:hypothetical protein
VLRTGRLWIWLVAALVGVSLANAAPASAAGGCSPASAPQIAPGATQSSDPAACAGGIEYWAMSLQDGDTLTVNGTPMPGGTPGYMDLNIYGPNIQTIGGQPLCNSDVNGSPFTETCVIPATGTYLLANDAGPGQFTPTVSGAAPSSRAAGGCASSSVPSAAAGVAQYTNSQVCQSQGGRQYWAMHLQVGDTLTVNGVPIPSSGGVTYMSLDIYGPDVQTIGQSLCSSDVNGSAFTETCVIPATGTYLLVSDAGSGQFTPRINHPLLSSLRRAFTRWSPFGRRSVLRVNASSPARMSVCVLIVLGWKRPPRRLSCEHSHVVVLAAGGHRFARAGSARIAVRFTSRARRLLARRRTYRLTLITIYRRGPHAPAITSTRIRFRPR